MPAPSDLATRLAEDLVEVGKLLGFETEKEHPIQEKSNFRIDVFWKMKMPEGSPFPEINISSIEIQYSYSPTSISHGIFKAEKTLHPAIHVVISYFKLTEDYVENVLKPNYPSSGLVIVDGEEEVRKLNLWITRFLAIEKEEERLIEKGKMIRSFAISKLPDTSKSEIEEKIRENFESEIKEVFLPPEITSLIETFVEVESRDKEYDRRIVDSVFESFIEFVQSKMKDYNVPRISISAHFLFSDFKIEQPFVDSHVELSGDIEIEQDDVIIRDENGYPLEVKVKNGIAYVDSEAGIVCREGLKATDIIFFIKEASEEIEKEMRKYRISKDDRKVLETILNSLG
jgi:hypothetical protein